MYNRLSLKEKLTYSCGNLGIGMITTIHMWYLVYFFFPPNDAGINYTVPQGAFVFGITILGIVMGAGRIFDAITDPIIANRSDNLRHKLGKRIPYMRRYAFGLAASYVLVFFVPRPNEIHTLNIIWLAFFMFISAFFVTLYSVPFYSLLIQMAKHPEDRIDLGTYNSAFWFSGMLITSFASGSWDFFKNTFNISSHLSIQISFVILGVVGLIFLLIPSYFINENKYTIKVEGIVSNAKISLRKSMKRVLGNRNFRIFLTANTLYAMATFMFETGLLYFITVLAMKQESLQGVLTTIIGALTLLCYPLVNKVSKAKGKKFMISLGFILFSLTFIDITLFGLVDFKLFGFININIDLLLILCVILSPLPQAIFGILPHVIVADCAEQDKSETGEDLAGMYIAVNGFFGKLAYSVATIIFTSLLVFGKDPSNDLGIRLTTIVGTILTALSIGLMSKYKEKLGETTINNKSTSNYSG